ncbi:hypothetical protein H6503_02810 [Candidatus Woesearchaeota archaeon]|nr:hypothetical protein [Candidatus Woesearchaeota archaeon]
MQNAVSMLIIVPIFISIYLGAAMQLVDLSEKVSDKAIDFADKMENSVPCAMEAIDLEECSPGIYNITWDEETAELNEINSELIMKSKRVLTQYTDQDI